MKANCVSNEYLVIFPDENEAMWPCARIMGFIVRPTELASKRISFCKTLSSLDFVICKKSNNGTHLAQACS